jgi:hypothetical protein
MTTTCSVPDCTRPATRRLRTEAPLCEPCYRAELATKNPQCKTEGCEGKARWGRLCWTCAQRLRRHGDVMTVFQTGRKSSLPQQIGRTR